MKKNNPAFKDEVDEILNNVLRIGWNGNPEKNFPDLSEARKALDQAYQKKFLERLPKEHIDSPLQQSYKLGGTDVPSYKRGYRQALEDVKAAIKKEVG